MSYRPSVSIKMDVNSGSNSHIHRQVIANLVKTQQAQQRNAPSALNSPMISRVHNVRPGCGSCGK